MVERRYYQFIVGDTLAGERIVAVESKHCSIEMVGSRFSDGIDAGAGETSLCHVIGGDVHLDLVDGIQGYRLGIGLTAGGGRIQSEGVVKDRSIQGKVVVLSVPSGKRQSIIGRRSRRGQSQIIVS